MSGKNENSAYKNLQEIIQLIQEKRNISDDDFLSLIHERLTKCAQQLDFNRKELCKMLLLVLVLVMLLIVGIGLCAHRNSILEDSALTQAQVIDQLNQQDSLYRVIQGVDSAGHFSYISIDGKLVTYTDLLHTLDSVRGNYTRLVKNIETNYPIDIDKRTGECVSEIWDLMQSLVLDKEGNIVYYNKNGHPISYSELAHKLDSLESKLIKEKNEKNKLLSEIELIQKQYPIVVVEDRGSIYVSSAQIDSAMLLLPHYRNKLRKAEDGNGWIVNF